MSPWPAFMLWTVAGTLGALAIAGLATIGIFVLPFALAATLVAALRAPAGWPGAMVGVGVISAWLGWLNRYGPGRHCWSTAEMSGCTDLYDPRPFFGVTLILTAIAVTLMRRQIRNNHREI